MAVRVAFGKRTLLANQDTNTPCTRLTKPLRSECLELPSSSLFAKELEAASKLTVYFLKIRLRLAPALQCCAKLGNIGAVATK